MPLNEWLLLITIIPIFLGLIYAAFVSYRENEARAARLFLFTLLDPVRSFAFIYFDYPYKSEIIWIILFMYWVLALIFIIPYGNKKGFINPIPRMRIDERDVMFSRLELKEGSERFDTYYKRRPENKFLDALRGFFSIIPASAFSSPNARAGNESVTRFIHNIWIGNRKFQLRRVAVKTARTSATFAERRN